MTHAELVAVAARWLKGRGGCRVICTRALMVANEQPDALGFTLAGFSKLVECKASRADFAADAKKPWRSMPELGMGSFRYYMAPAGLLTADEIPAGWGLLEVKSGRVSVIKEPIQFTTCNVRAEIQQLVARADRGVESWETANTTHEVAI